MPEPYQIPMLPRRYMPVFAPEGKYAAAMSAAYYLVLQEYGILTLPAPEAAALTLEQLKQLTEEKASKAARKAVGLAVDGRMKKTLVGARYWPASLVTDIEFLADIYGEDIPYHQRWTAEYPRRVAQEMPQNVAKVLAKDVARYEQLYPSFFSGKDGGLQHIYDMLARARNIALDELTHLQKEVQSQGQKLSSAGIHRALTWLAAMESVEPEPVYLQSEELPEAAPEGLLEWGGSKTDLVELAYALLESGLLKAPEGRANTIKTFAAVFGLEIPRPEGHLQNIKKRTLGLMTPVLDKAKAALLRLRG